MTSSVQLPTTNNMTEETTREESASGTVQKAFTVTLLVILAVMGLASCIIGFVHLDSCGHAVLMPGVVAMNGVVWLVPLLLLLFLNLAGPQDDDLKCLLSFLHAFFLLCLLFLFACTVYTLVTVNQVKSLSMLCSQSWLPPYMLFILVADWLSLIVFLRLFCVHPLPPERPPPIEFRHLKNLPPLVVPWNRHRVLRTY
ncbi:uncharacterized protein LOC143283388 [Babylonia areolata]|uniref:uncharacterized protein LOC143283388 n=1 Tax=Babylonia areolata TaxID=304850 RepID=UPI003FD507A5